MSKWFRKTGAVLSVDDRFDHIYAADPAWQTEAERKESLRLGLPAKEKPFDEMSISKVKAWLIKAGVGVSEASKMTKAEAVTRAKFIEGQYGTDAD